MCVTGSKAFIANTAIENEPSSAVGEWMSAVFVSSTNGSSTACLLLELKFEDSVDFAKRINVELNYEDVNNTVRKASLFDYHAAKDNFYAKERFGTFQFNLNNVLRYQVCTSSFIIAGRCKTAPILSISVPIYRPSVCVCTDYTGFC